MNARFVVRIEVEHHDVLRYQTDILALKFAQALYGVDRKVVERVEQTGITIFDRLPDVGEALIVPARGAVASPEVLFIGVPPLGLFGYAEIRTFSRSVMRKLAAARPQVRDVAMTLHGRGFGLDEAEAFKAQLAGLLDAFEADEVPPALELVSIVESEPRTADILRALLDEAIPTHHVIPGRSLQARETLQARSALKDVGEASAAKPHVFVAMPFAPEFGDRFHYGIKGAVNAAGYLVSVRISHPLLETLSPGSEIASTEQHSSSPTYQQQTRTYILRSVTLGDVEFGLFSSLRRLLI